MIYLFIFFFLTLTKRSYGSSALVLFFPYKSCLNPQSGLLVNTMVKFMNQCNVGLKHTITIIIIIIETTSTPDRSILLVWNLELS